MPENNDFAVIYSNDDLAEYDKYWLYILLLEMNHKFISDVNAIRQKYNIKPPEPHSKPGDIEAEYNSLLKDDGFINSVRAIASKIKVQGNWVSGLALYVCGESAQASLYPDVDLHKIEAITVTDTDEPHVVLKIYGDVPLDELQVASKNIRTFIEAKMDYENVKNLNDTTLRKMLAVHKLKTTLSFKDIAIKLDEMGFALQEYSSVRRQYNEYLKYADRLY